MLRAAIANDRLPISLVLVDLGLARGAPIRSRCAGNPADGPRLVPVVVFAGSVASPDQIAASAAAGVSGYVNEYADPPHILPALAPHLFPDSFNRRTTARVAITIPMSFRAGQTIAAAQARDLSKGGVGIQTMEPLPAGTPLQLTMRLPGVPAEISAFGRVIWSDRRVGMGVQFERLPAEAQHMLDGFVERR
jgi:uncharacterized protein (TIGR02266 family)